MIIKVNNFLMQSSFSEVDGVARLEVDLLLGEHLGVLLLLPGARNVAAPGVEVPSEATSRASEATTGTSGSVTNFLGESSADPLRNFLVHRVALLFGDLNAVLVGNLSAILTCNLATLFLRHLVAHLLRDTLTVIIWDLSQLLLLNISTLVVGVVPAASWDRGPHLVVASPLPLVLAVLLV